MQGHSVSRLNPTWPLSLAMMALLIGFVFVPAARAAVGDSVFDGTEQCDDGNVIAGDGCDATGQVEPHYSCVGEASVCSYVASVWFQSSAVVVILGMAIFFLTAFVLPI